MNTTVRGRGGPLHYPVNYFTIRNRVSGHLTGAWKWRICFAHVHGEPLQVSVPATFPPMLFLPDDHAPIFGIWFRAGLRKTWERSLLVREPLLRSWSLSSSFFSYRLSSADALRFQSETSILKWMRVLQYSYGNDLIRNLSKSVLNTRNRLTHDQIE